MDAKNDVEVIINGKQYTLSGNESSEYLQKVAVHINEKYVYDLFHFPDILDSIP